MISTQGWTRRLTAAAVSLAVVLAGLLFLNAPVAQAGECQKIHTPVYTFTVCGAALNEAKNTMYAARIANEPSAETCTVRDTQGHVLSRTYKCVSRSVGSGKTSSFKDTDAIMFKRSFRVNGHQFKSGEWVKIRVAAVCYSPASFIQPRCYAI